MCSIFREKKQSCWLHLLSSLTSVLKFPVPISAQNFHLKNCASSKWTTGFQAQMAQMILLAVVPPWQYLSRAVAKADWRSCMLYTQPVTFTSLPSLYNVCTTDMGHCAYSIYVLHWCFCFFAASFVFYICTRHGAMCIVQCTLCTLVYLPFCCFICVFYLYKGRVHKKKRKKCGLLPNRGAGGSRRIVKCQTSILGS